MSSAPAMTEPAIASAWFEMPDLRRLRFDARVWIPLRASQTVREEGTDNVPGHVREMFCAGSVAIPIDKRLEGEKLSWTDIGLLHGGGPHAFRDGRYKPCEVYQYNDHDDLGIDLVFEQSFSDDHPTIWHLSQDLILALDLRKEGNSWLRPREGYVEVVREHLNADGRQVLIEIRSDFLRDYLAARGLALRLAIYCERAAIIDDVADLPWAEKPLVEQNANDKFEARANQIDDLGGPHGGNVAVLELWRTDVDPNEDVPVFGESSEQNTAGRSATFTRRSGKNYRVSGELWRQEWIEPSARSERVRGDDPADTLSYVVDAAGTRQTNLQLDSEDIGRYLWFAPKVIQDLMATRGGGLAWYTHDTGGVWCSPNYSVHFGVNAAGVVTTYAYDVARLDLWQQRMWAAHNIPPNGPPSDELLQAQMKSKPAKTDAPEALLSAALSDLDRLFEGKFGRTLFLAHADTKSILRSVHRFRALDHAGLLSLAKDITRLVADRLDMQTLRMVITPPANATWRSLKHLQQALATVIPADQARPALTPLVGVYELRLGDAHLPSSTIKEAFTMVGIDEQATPIVQGTQLIAATATALLAILSAFAAAHAKSLADPTSQTRPS